MSSIISELFNLTVNRNVITIIILLVTCIIYTYSLLHGIKGISKLAKICIYLFFFILGYVFLFGGQAKFILENGFSSIGTMINNFIPLSTYTDPLRENYFPQNWTIYFWAYWMVWCVAAPFFIGEISKGRTIKQTIIGGYIFGVGSTILSFIILGNYSIGLQVTNKFDFLSVYQLNGDIYNVIISIIKSLPLSSFVLVLVLITMIAFYATSFDSIAYTASCYSYRKLGEGEKPHKFIQFIWCILLILLPIALIFADSSMTNLQSVSIIAAFPIGIVMILIIISFFREINDYYKKDK